MDIALFIGKVWPEPASSAAGTRMVQLLEAFAEQGYQLYFGSAAAQSAHSLQAETLGAKAFPVELNSDNFNKQLATLNPDIVVFDRFTTEEQFGWRVAENCPQAIRILNSEDLHFLRNGREKALKENKENAGEHLKNSVTMREIASILRCDLTLIISSYEIKLLEEKFQLNPQLLFYLPFLFKPITGEQSQLWREYHEREDFIFIGNFLHAPNADAALYLKKEIWPLIRAIKPEARLRLCGAYAGSEITELHKPSEGFMVEGRVKNSGEALHKARVCLAPLRAGAGLKGKVAEAMMNGTPSVCSSIAAEGLATDDTWPGIIADNSTEFARAAVLLYSNKELWNKSQQKISRTFNAVFNRKKHLQEFFSTLDQLRNNIMTHRNNNFYGAMLMHHTMHSSRWLSKYIIAKNQLKRSENEKTSDR